MTNTIKPRILFLNRSYWPDSEATGQLLTALCEGLAADFDVHVLVGKPNVAAGNMDWPNVKERNGVTIHRVNHFTFAKTSLFLKGLNFLSFAAVCRKHVLRLPVPDVVIFETDPFLLPFVADRLQKKTGCKMVGYLQDIYPDVAVALKKVKDSWWVRRLRRRMFDVYRRCDRMVVLSSDMKNLLVDAGVSPDTTSIIPNWADTEKIYPIPRESNVFLDRHNLHERFVVMYSGNLGLTQRLEEFVDAAALLQDNSKIQFVFVGRGAKKKDLKRQVASLGLTNVLFLDYQPLEELAHSLSAADLHLVPLAKELSQCLMPSKLYGILAAGRPYLTNAPPESELRRLTLSNRVGHAVEAGCPQRVAAGIRAAVKDHSALQQLNDRCRVLAESEYTNTHALEAFTRLLTGVLAPQEKNRTCSEES